MSELLLERRISKKAFIGHYVGAVVAGIILAVVLFMTPFGIFAPIAVLPVLAVAAWAALSRMGGCYRLYEDRLEVESGILARRIDNVELFRVRDVSLSQGLFGRLTDFGDVYVHSTDASTPTMHIRGVDNPKDFYQNLRQRVTESRAANRTMIVEEGRDIPEV